MSSSKMPEGWISWKDAALQEAAEGPIMRTLQLPAVGTERQILDNLSRYPRLVIEPGLQSKLDAAARVCPIKRGWFWGVRREYRGITFFASRKFFPGGNPTLRSDWVNFALLRKGHFMTLWEALELLSTLREPFNPAREKGLVIPCAQTGDVDGPPFSLHITATIREEEGQIHTGPWTMSQARFEQYSFGHGTSMGGHRIAIMTDPSVGLIEGWLRGH